MTAVNLNLLAALPEIFLLAAVSVILIVDLFLDDAHRHWSYVLTLFTLAVVRSSRWRRRVGKRRTPSTACSWTTAWRTC